MGKLCISVEVLPKVIADAKPAVGRSAEYKPDAPPPQGRIKWSMVWNPCYQECCSQKSSGMWYAFARLLIIALAVAILPFVDSLLSLIERLTFSLDSL